MRRNGISWLLIGLLVLAGCGQTDQYASEMEIADRYFLQEKYTKAEDHYVEAMHIRPKEAEPVVQLVYVYEKLDEPEKQKKMEEKLNDQFPEEAERLAVERKKAAKLKKPETTEEAKKEKAQESDQTETVQAEALPVVQSAPAVPQPACLTETEFLGLLPAGTTSEEMRAVLERFYMNGFRPIAEDEIFNGMIDFGYCQTDTGMIMSKDGGSLFNLDIYDKLLAVMGLRPFCQADADKWEEGPMCRFEGRNIWLTGMGGVGSKPTVKSLSFEKNGDCVNVSVSLDSLDMVNLSGYQTHSLQAVFRPGANGAYILTEMHEV